jgi:hypothetical protein
MGISFHMGPVWGSWRRAHLPGTLRDGKGGSVDGASLSLKRLRGGGLGGGAPSLGTLEDILEGSSDGASLCEGLHKGTWREGSFTAEPER